MNDVRIPEIGNKAARAEQDVPVQDNHPSKTVDVLIVGAGFAGLGSAIRLQQAGVKDIVIVERGSAIGGTWRDNQYPGAACDIPSNLYSYSFAQNPDWTRGFSGAPEILKYIHSLADEFKLRELIKLDHNVTSMDFDEDSGVWNIHFEKQQAIRARTVVMAQGPLSNSSLPNIAGIQSFKGKIIHSARWDHDYDYSGKRVAVIGTGASAIQIVPELVKTAAKVKVFQRTPAYVLPRPDYASPEWMQAVFRKMPMTQSAFRRLLYLVHESMALGVVWTTPLTRVFERLAKAYLQSQVKDSWMRRQLTPDFRLGCKRILISNDWYKSLQADNAELITWPIAKIAADGIRSAEGLEHQVDCIVCATGFDVAKSGGPFPIRGIGGHQLDADWARGSQAYKSASVTGYPNLFLTFGPNSGPGHNSALVYMESQIGYLVKGIKHILGNDLKVMDVRPETQARFNKSIQKRLKRTNWNSGCKSWYLTEDGFNATMYPGLATQFARQMQNFDPNDYVQSRA